MVEIPDDVAKRYAAQIRSRWDGLDSISPLADLLDPKPPTLREQVQAALDSLMMQVNRDEFREADAVLAVVADWLDGRHYPNSAAAIRRGGSDG